MFVTTVFATQEARLRMNNRTRRMAAEDRGMGENGKNETRRNKRMGILVRKGWFVGDGKIPNL